MVALGGVHHVSHYANELARGPVWGGGRGGGGGGGLREGCRGSASKPVGGKQVLSSFALVTIATDRPKTGGLSPTVTATGT